MAKSTKKNLLYRARQRGLQVSTRRKTIYVTEEEKETGCFDDVIERLCNEYGFVCENVANKLSHFRVLVYPHSVKEWRDVKEVSKMLRKNGSFPVEGEPSFLLSAEKLFSCSALYLFKGWHEDDDALLMMQVAKKLKLEIFIH